MTDDQLTRVCAALARLAEAVASIPRDVYAVGDLVIADAPSVNADGDEPSIIVADCIRSPVVDPDDLATVLQQAPALLALAEALVLLVDEPDPNELWWKAVDDGTGYCHWCRRLTSLPDDDDDWRDTCDHAPNCPAVSVDAALAALAALADAPGEVR